MPELTITQVARQTGLRTSAIRYYESIKVLPAPRMVNGRRRYHPEIVDRLAFIQVAKRLGLSLGEIERMLRNHDEETPLSERWQALANARLAETDRLLQDLVAVKQLLARALRCGCDNLVDCIECILVNCAAESTGRIAAQPAIVTPISRPTR